MADSLGKRLLAIGEMLEPCTPDEGRVEPFPEYPLDHWRQDLASAAQQLLYLANALPDTNSESSYALRQMMGPIEEKISDLQSYLGRCQTHVGP